MKKCIKSIVNIEPGIMKNIKHGTTTNNKYNNLLFMTIHHKSYMIYLLFLCYFDNLIR